MNLHDSFNKTNDTNEQTFHISRHRLLWHGNCFCTVRATFNTNGTHQRGASYPCHNLTDFSTTDATTLETPATGNTTTTAEPPRGRQKRYAPRRSFSPRIAALAELGVGGDFDINATLGAQLFHFFYLGGGLNMTYWYDNFNSDFNRTDVNFVINPRFEIPTHSIVTPYIDFKTGLSVNHSHSTYWSLGTGVQIKRFVVGLAYSVQNIRDYYVYNQRDIFNSVYHYYSNGALTLRLGMKF